MFTDPPYNVRIDGHVSRARAGPPRRIRHGIRRNERSPIHRLFDQIRLGLAAKASRDGALHYVCMDWRHLFELMSAGREVYDDVINLCVWNKDNGGMGSFYRSKHELVTVFKVGHAPHINNVELGRHGRNRTNVWDYAGANTFRAGRLEELAMHPTVKPVALVADVMRDASCRADLVLDPFAGSGTTVIAAEKTGRRACALEIDPRYVDVTIRRWQLYTGKPALLDTTTTAFDEIAEQRLAETKTKPPAVDAHTIVPNPEAQI